MSAHFWFSLLISSNSTITLKCSAAHFVSYSLCPVEVAVLELDESLSISDTRDLYVLAYDLNEAS
jgi:hypothetical protein